MIALILSSLISIAVLNHDTKSSLKHELGWSDEGHAADGNSHLPASPVAATVTTATQRCRYPKLNPDDNAGVAFESPFRRFWHLNCENDLVLAFRFFVAGLVSFLISVIFTTIVQFRVAAGAWYIAIIVASTALIWVCVSLLPQWSGAAKSSEAPPLLLGAYPRRLRR
jgi:hypothetical protein